MSQKKSKSVFPDDLDQGEYIHRSDYKVLFLKYWAIRKAYNAIWKKYHKSLIDRGIEKVPKRMRKKTFFGVGKPPVEFRE